MGGAELGHSERFVNGVRLLPSIALIWEISEIRMVDTREENVASLAATFGSGCKNSEYVGFSTPIRRGDVVPEADHVRSLPVG